MVNVDNIFSKEALDKLRSPERLDVLLPITTPVTWMALAGIVVLMVSVILWSVYGSFTVKADGMGMIIDSGGVANVTHTTTGLVDEVCVHKGQRVKRGDVLAYLYMPAQLTESIVAQYSVGQAQNSKEATSRALEYDSKAGQRMDEYTIRCMYDGVVDEVLIEEGMMATAGHPLFTVRRDEGNSNVSGIFYIPVNMGKRVEPGQTIQLAPNGVDTTLSGSLLGVVRSVSDYPISQTAVENGLAGNAQLAQWVFNRTNSSLVEVKFDLVTDPGSESGFLWTSTVGKHKPVTPGSYCTGSIVIERTPPLEKVFYKFSQWLRNR